MNNENHHARNITKVQSAENLSLSIKKVDWPNNKFYIFKIVSEYQEKVEQQKLKLENQKSDTETSVDRNLLKNLIVGYFCAPNNSSKMQILKLLRYIVDFVSNFLCLKIY